MLTTIYRLGLVLSICMIGLLATPVSAQVQPPTPACEAASLDEGPGYNEATVFVRGEEVRILSRGSFLTSPEGLHLEGMCPGSTSTLDVLQDGVVHQLVYRAWRGSLVERTYVVGRQGMFWGREANSLKARLLPEVVRRLQDGA